VSSRVFWDAHACVPLARVSSLAILERHRQAGCGVVGVNAGFDGMRPEATMATLSRFAGELERSQSLHMLCDVPSEPEQARDIAVYFDVEGADVLDGDVGKLEELVALGVRSFIPVYNRANRAGGGCHDRENGGLTSFGRELIRRQNDLGVIVDASHCSVRTSIEMCEASEKPVVFSHSNCWELVHHPRNITDEQMRAAAATDGVIGINGASVFLGSDDFARAICEHILHAISVVGARHVGIGLDFVYDMDDLAMLVADAPTLFPEDGGAYETNTFCSPETLPDVQTLLVASGLEENAIEAVLWGNFARVASRTFST
jgi:membrane dipeptidase